MTEHDLLFSFGDESTLGQVRIYHGDGFINYFPSSFDVETSVDGSEWFTVVSESGYSPEPGTWGVWNFAPQTGSMQQLRR